MLRSVLYVTFVTSAFGQSFDITPLVGGRFGGSLKLEQPGAPNFHADIADSLTFGISGGYRFSQDECTNCGLIEFRWMRQDTHLQVLRDPAVISPAPSFRPSVTFDYFLGDLTHEWEIEEPSSIRPFITGTLGAVRMAAPASAATRFTWGIGAGIKIFPHARYGVRIQAEYLPIVLHSELQRLACVGGGCVVVLNGGIANQFQVMVGPAFRF